MIQSKKAIQLCLLLVLLAGTTFHLLGGGVPSTTDQIRFGSTSNLTPSSVQSATSVQSLLGFKGPDEKTSEAFGCSVPCAPPDVSIGTGPNHVVEVVNTAAAIYSKVGSPILNASLTIFFGKIGPNCIFTDPKVIYDATSARWFATVIVSECKNTPDSFRLAVSTSSDPTKPWNSYQYAAPGIDQPIPGVSDDKVVVGAHNPAAFWVFKKSDLVNAVRNPSFNSFNSTSIPHLPLLFGIQSLSSTTTQYLVGLKNSTTLQLYTVTGIPPNSVVSHPVNFTIPAVSPPTSAVALGGGTINFFSGIELFPLDAAWYQGRLWLTVSAGCVPSGDNQTRSCVRLIEINTSTLSLMQDFDFGDNGMYLFYPALRVDGAGNLNIIYGYSSNTNSTCCYPSLAVTGQGVDDSVNSLAQPVTIKAGLETFASNRYGDYFGAAIDPSNRTLVWVGGEYIKSGVWTTFLSQMRVVPDFRITINPATSAIPASSSAGSNITLTSVNGFTGTVILTTSVLPLQSNGPTATLVPTQVILSSEGSSTTKLTVSTTSSTPTGLYTITVTGSAGSQTHYTIFAAAVTPIIFTINNVTTFTGVTVTTTGTLSLNSPSTAFIASGTATVVATNSTTGSTLFSKTYTLTGLTLIQGSSGDFSTKFLLNIPVNPYRLSSDVVIDLSGTGTTNSVQVTRNIDINANGVVDQADANIISAAFGCSMGSECYNPQADLNADGIVNIFDLYLYGQYVGALDKI